MNVDNKPNKRRDAAGSLAVRRHQNDDNNLSSVTEKENIASIRSVGTKRDGNMMKQ